MHLSFRQWFLVILFSILILATSAIHTLHAAFFTYAVEWRGVGPVGSTVIFAMFDLGAICFSILIGVYVPYWSLKRVLCTSTFLQAFSVTLFGLLWNVRGHWMFLGSASVLRFIEGVGFVGTAVAVYSSIPTEFQTVSVPVIYGVLNMCFGIGNSGGPLIGDVLFELGGFLCPFLVIGVILVTIGLFMPLIFWKLPLQLEMEPDYNVFALFRKPLTLMNILVIGLEMMLLMLIYAIFPNYLRSTFYLNGSAAGFTFAIIVVIQALASPLWGFLAGNMLSPQIAIISGGFLTLVGSILIGPLPLFGVNPNLLVTVIGVALLSIGISAVFLASFLCIVKEAWRYGFLQTRATMGMVSSAYMGTLFVGAALGSASAGLIYNIVGIKFIPYAFFTLSVLIFSLNVFYTGGTVFKQIFRRSKSVESGIEDPEPSEEDVTETTPLISSSLPKSPFSGDEKKPEIDLEAKH